MASFLKSALVAAAKAKNKERIDSGFVGTISPCPDDLVDRVVAYLDMGTTDVFVDLGCGDGRWCIAAAQRSAAVCIGVDMDVGRIQLAAQKCATLELVCRVDWLLCDFIKGMRLHAASVVVFYLSRQGSECVRDKAVQECAEGTILVAVGFQVHGWTAYHSVASVSKKQAIKAYFYKFSKTSM